MAGLEVTDVKVQLVDEGRLKAFATVTLNACFVVRDVKVIDGNNGLFVAMPSRRKPDGTYRDIAHPLNSDCRTYFEKAVLDAYTRETQLTIAVAK
jgi:stage V sporulation protein G